MSLKKWLYGMRPPACAREQGNSGTLGEFGMVKGVFAPTVFLGVERGIRCVVHGDDFTCLGWQKDLDEALEFLKRHYYEL